MFYRLLVTSLFYAFVVGHYAKLSPRDDCHDSFTRCAPDGASTSNAPAVGDSLSGLYVDILNTINKVQNTKRDEEEPLNLRSRDSGGSVCCADGTQCLLIQDLQLPFCYDKFTTNYFLPGGAYGQVVSGNYTSSGSEANLLAGTYTLDDGTTGTIATPNTATLTLPTQYTGSGVGSAIPVTALGEWTTYTTTIPATTIPATTIAAHVLAASIVSGSTVEPATTEPAMTLAATTVAPKTSVVTTRVAKATSSQESVAGALEIENDLAVMSTLLASVLTYLFML